MSQRASGYERKDRDFYATPAWVTQACLPHLRDVETVWEPAAGAGHMVDVLRSWTGCVRVVATDIHPQHPDIVQVDFLGDTPRVSVDEIGAIVTNPPYELATEFCEQALRRTHPFGLIAMLLRTDFDHAKSRMYLFRDHPAFSKKVVLTRRIVWFVEEDGKPKAQPSFNHAWFIWDWRHKGAPTLAYGP